MPSLKETICRIRESYQTRSNYSTGGSTAANELEPKNAGSRASLEAARIGAHNYSICTYWTRNGRGSSWRKPRWPDMGPGQTREPDEGPVDAWEAGADLALATG